MIGEIPAPTFGEQRRVEFLCQRFSECSLHNVSPDEIGNALAILPGTGENEESIALVAHVDTVFSEGTPQSVSLRADRVIGPSVADNSLGLAVLTTLPMLLDELNLTLRSNLIFVGAVRSLGRGNLEGTRFFLQNNTMPLKAGICVEGAQLGRLSFSSNGMVRGEITVTVPEEYDWTRFGTTSAVMVLHNIVERIGQIPLPQQPRSRIVIGSIHAGNSFNRIPTHAVLRFEARSESGEIVQEVRQRMQDIVGEVSSRSRARISLDILAECEPEGLEISHPLVRCTNGILTELGVKPEVSPSISDLTAFIAKGIPAVTLGISRAENINELNESVEIYPIERGLAQLIALLVAIDGGFCNGY